MESLRVLLADDHQRVAQALGEYVSEAFQLVGTVGDGITLVEAARALKPDVIVSDLSMPGADGLTAMRHIRTEFPRMPVILLTNYEDPALVRHALAVGAAGVVLKVHAPADLVQAIRVAAKGGTYVSSTIALAGGG